MRSLALAAVLASGAIPGPPAAIQTLPASRGGHALLGRTLPPLVFQRWLNTPRGAAPDTHGKVTLYRWWTDSCPYCESTLPAIEQLRRELGPRGLVVIGVYHAKPERPVTNAFVSSAAEQRGFRGPIAIDESWAQLDAVWPPDDRSATSVSLLVDRAGVIRFVHPGPDYFPSRAADAARQNADYQALRHDIEVLLGGTAP